MIVACASCSAILSTLWRNQCFCGPECMEAWNKTAQLSFTNTERSKTPARLAGPRSVDPHNIKHVVVATQSEPGAFQSEEPARLIAAIIQDAGREFGKVLYGGEKKPYSQNPLFEMAPSSRSVEPHKKRREK